MVELGELYLEINNKKIYKRDGIVTKVFDHNNYSASDVMKEAMNQAYASECGLPAPEVKEIFKVGDDFAIASEEIEGKTLEELMKEHPENKKKYISQLVKIQISLLKHKVTNLKLPKLKDKLNDYISNSGLESTVRYDLHARLEKMPNHYLLCHGDIAPHNIIIRPDDTYVILDWAHATRGNATADAAATYLLFVLHDDEKGGEMYLKEFCKKVGVEVSYVNEWISVVSAAKLKTTKDPQKKALLERFINVVEY